MCSSFNSPRNPYKWRSYDSSNTARTTSYGRYNWSFGAASGTDCNSSKYTSNSQLKYVKKPSPQSFSRNTSSRFKYVRRTSTASSDLPSNQSIQPCFPDDSTISSKTSPKQQTRDPSKICTGGKPHTYIEYQKTLDAVHKTQACATERLTDTSKCASSVRTPPHSHSNAVAAALQTKYKYIRGRRISDIAHNVHARQSYPTASLYRKRKESVTQPPSTGFIRHSRYKLIKKGLICSSKFQHTKRLSLRKPRSNLTVMTSPTKYSSSLSYSCRSMQVTPSGGTKISTRFTIRRVRLSSLNYNRDMQTNYRQKIRRAAARLTFRRAPMCLFYVRTGRCKTGKQCRFTHDSRYLRLCPRFLSQSCPLSASACPLAHVFDPCRLPECEFFERNACTHRNCPYLHSRHPPGTGACFNFLRGRCTLGRACNKRHVLSSKTTRRRYEARGRIATKGKFIGVEAKCEDTQEQSCELKIPPQGSLRNIFPAPEFIPLL